MSNSGLVIPIGDIDRRLLEKVVRTLNERFSIPFNIGEALAVPEEAYNSDRSQYYSSEILKGF